MKGFDRNEGEIKKLEKQEKALEKMERKLRSKLKNNKGTEGMIVLGEGG